MFNFFEMVGVIGHSFGDIFVFAFFFLFPARHLIVAVAGCWFLGEHGLPGVFHRQDVFKHNSFI